MHNNMRVFIGNKRKSFEQRQLVVRLNVNKYFKYIYITHMKEKG